MDQEWRLRSYCLAAQRRTSSLPCTTCYPECVIGGPSTTSWLVARDSSVDSSVGTSMSASGMIYHGQQVKRIYCDKSHRTRSCWSLPLPLFLTKAKQAYMLLPMEKQLSDQQERERIL